MLGMSSGYVLNFSNRTFAEFFNEFSSPRALVVRDEVIDHPARLTLRAWKHGASKNTYLRELWFCWLTTDIDSSLLALWFLALRILAKTYLADVAGHHEADGSGYKE